jgi:hypothetical protein
VSVGKSSLNIVGALFALIAAGFWFLSAYGKLPVTIAYWDAAPEDDPFRMALKFSARMNRWAASFSGLSALCVGIALFLPT